MFRLPRVGSALDPSVASLRRELKYLVPAVAAAPLKAWLGAVAAADREHPPAPVFTIYYDTPGLALLGEKIDSDYYKSKIRVRWYGARDGSAGRAFAEIKRRIGTRRHKQRVTLDTGGSVLGDWPLSDPRWQTLLEPLRAVADLPSRLSPTLRLRYDRARFVDRATAARLALDERITVTAVASRLGPSRTPAVLPQAVFECKGGADDLPPAIAPLTRYQARRASFSKYLAGLEAACPHLR